MSQEIWKWLSWELVLLWILLDFHLGAYQSARIKSELPNPHRSKQTVLPSALGSVGSRIGKGPSIRHGLSLRETYGARQNRGLCICSGWKSSPLQDEGSPWSVPQGCSIPTCPLSSVWAVAAWAGKSSLTAFARVPEQVGSSACTRSLWHVLWRPPFWLHLWSAMISARDGFNSSSVAAEPSSLLPAASHPVGISGPTQPQTAHKPPPITFPSLSLSPS